MKTARILTAAIAVLLVTGTFAHAQMLITEIYPNPINSENGGEAVELFNSGDDPIDIGSWVIRTKSVAVDAKIPKGRIINPKSHFLIADLGWNESRDELIWPFADYEESITLVNEDGFVQLLSSEGVVIDTVGWGKDANEKESEPTASPKEGKSLQRIKNETTYVDTGNNLADFLVDNPNFMSVGDMILGTGILTLILDLTAQKANLNSIIIGHDDLPEDGVQIAPIPGTSRLVPFFIIIEGEADNLTVDVDGTKISANLTEKFNNGSALYIASYELPFHSPPGQRKIRVVVNGEEYVDIFEVLSLRALSLNETSAIITSESVDIGIRNLGNIPLNLRLVGNALIAKNTSIGVESISYEVSAGEFYFKGTLAEKTATIPLALPSGNESWAEMVISINPPSGIPRGIYVGSVEVVAI